jgi:hypothetical protein
MKTRGKHLVRVGAITIPLVCAACSTTGTAVGELEQPASKSAREAVTLVWKSDRAEPLRGSISGTLPDGTRYSGRYFEVVRTADARIYAPAWEGWSPYWSGWLVPGYAGPMRELDWAGFAEIYTGHVIANLKTADPNQRMRCRFNIDRPREGLLGGGVGDCQLSNGERIEHVVLAPS